MRRPVLALALFLTALTTGRAQSPGFGYALDNSSRIIGVNLSNGSTTVNATTLFAANAAAYADGNGAQGSLIYGASSANGELGLWDRATNTQLDLGNISTPATGKTYTNALPAGTTVNDAAYWNGSTGPQAGYYVVTANHQIYRVDFTTNASAAHNITGIANVTLVMTIPTTTLTQNFAFGDIAFSPLDGSMYLSDSANGFSRFDLTNGATTKLGTRYDGQIAFGEDGKLYGVGNSAGGTGTGNDFYQINLADGSLIGAAITNTDPGHTYTDFSGPAMTNVPEPGVFALATLGGAAGIAGYRRRRKQGRDASPRHSQILLTGFVRTRGYPENPGTASERHPYLVYDRPLRGLLTRFTESAYALPSREQAREFARFHRALLTRGEGF